MTDPHDKSIPHQDQPHKPNHEAQVSIGHTERASKDVQDPVARRAAEKAAQTAHLDEAIAGADSVQDKIIAALREVHDPEIPVNIYDLGLIYNVAVDPQNDNQVQITMTLTSPACPVAEALPAEVRAAAERVPEVGKVRVELTFDPPWSPEKMSEDARLMLGFM